ncbi:MAG: hypothetical protein HQ592_04405 [Planctomycetes bacterium]|nr:hypothetical protein [Planctomycetota bacterium]
MSRGFAARCLATITLLLVAGSARGEGVMHRHYTMKKLMPCGMVIAIETAGRYVWFGGWALRPGEDHGLARYDKQTDEWKLFLESESMIADEINTIVADGERLWIGSGSDWRWNRGLHLYDPLEHTNKRFTVKDGLPYWRVRGVAPLEDAVWVATRQAVARYDRKTRTWKAFSRSSGHLVNNFITSIHADDRNVFVGSFGAGEIHNGLETYDMKTGRWQNLNKQNSLFRSAVTAIDGDETTIWLLTQHGLITCDKWTRKFSNWPINHQPAKDSNLRNIVVMQDKVFLGSDTGLHVWDKETGEWQTYDSRSGLRYGNVYALGADEDYVWCADKLGRGISRLDRRRRRWEYFHYREGSPSNHIRSLVTDGTTLYVATLESGLWKYDIRRGRWTNLNLKLKSGPVRFHYRGEKTPVKYGDIRQMILHDGRVWMATNHGLCLHDPNGEVDIEVLSRENFPMLCLAFFNGKWFCGGQRDGLRTFDPETEAWDDIGKRIGLSKKIGAIQPGADAVWLSDGRKVYRLAPDGKTAAPVGAAPEGKISSLLLREGKLWIGTDHGLWTYDIKAKSAEQIDKARLPSPIVLSLAYTRGRVWIGTEGGLASCTGAQADWRTLTKDDELVYNIISAIAGDSRHLWVGTMGGGFSRLMGMFRWKRDDMEFDE